MNSVPAHFLTLSQLDLSDKVQSEVLENGVRLGDRVELDLDALMNTHPDVADALRAYDAKVRAFWDNYVETGVGGECFITERTVATFNKVDKKGLKLYLKGQVKALEEINGVGDALAEVLSGVFDEVKLSSLGVVASKEGNLVSLTLNMPGKQEWPQELGGTAGRGEIGRVLEIKVSHAKSHDRKNQRLLEVKVRVKEIWPKV